MAINKVYNLPKDGAYIIGSSGRGRKWIEQWSEHEPIGTMQQWCEITEDEYLELQLTECGSSQFQDRLRALWIQRDKAV